MDLTSRSTQGPVPVYHKNSQRHLHLEADLVHSSRRCQSPTVNGILTGISLSERAELPKVGQTRCYWALLTTSLRFIVLDPVLRHHLQDQAAQILDCALLDFVHPEEKESAQRDLGNVLEERTLHGSVTRVRYCRLSRVRRLLGWSDSSLPYPPTFPAELIAVDADYMAVYLVVNCVADDLVLCFIHAVVDIAPRADNDELHKTEWSNWCSTYGFEEEQARALYQRLCEIATPAPNRFDTLSDPSIRLLQILRNQTDRPLVLSWPPDSALSQAGYIVPTADDLSQLVLHVQIGCSIANGGDNDARTSCTRRYKSIQTIRLQTAEGSRVVQVESIFIPHGTIIFACHKVSGKYLDMYHGYSSIESQRNRQLSQITGADPRGIGDPGDHAYNDSPLATSQRDLASQTYVQQWVDGQSQSQPQPHHYTWDDPKGAVYVLPDQLHGDLGFSEKHIPITARMSDIRIQMPYVTSTESMTVSVAPSTAHVPRASDKEPRSPSHDLEGPVIMVKDRPVRERNNGCGRGQGNPPAGVAQCAHCQTTRSPEWRKGPNGKKELCNACGLRFSRSRAKKDGVVSRKRKEKEKEASLIKQPRLKSDLAVAMAVAEAQNPISHWENLPLLPSQTPVSSHTGDEHSLPSNGLPSTQIPVRPDANLGTGPVSLTFDNVETSPAHRRRTSVEKANSKNSYYTSLFPSRIVDQNACPVITRAVLVSKSGAATTPGRQ